MAVNVSQDALHAANIIAQLLDERRGAGGAAAQHAAPLHSSTYLLTFRRRTATSMSRNRFAPGASPNRSSDATPPRASAECTIRPAPAQRATWEILRPSAKHSRSPAS